VEGAGAGAIDEEAAAADEETVVAVDVALKR
jgi:hypothetical protein